MDDFIHKAVSNGFRGAVIDACLMVIADLFPGLSAFSAIDGKHAFPFFDQHGRIIHDFIRVPPNARIGLMYHEFSAFAHSYRIGGHAQQACRAGGQAMNFRPDRDLA